MAAENFNACLAEVLKHEGGFTQIKSDPGNWTGGKVGVGTLKGTNMGISAAAYPNENIKGMTRERAAAIYRRDYWDAVKGDDLPAGMDFVAFDGAVNSGASRGAKWLQAALGVTQDGKIGPATLTAAGKADAGMVIDRACNARLAFLRSLGTWPTFGKGWSTRVEGVRATAKAMATPPRPAPKPVPVVDTIPATAPSGPPTMTLIALVVFTALLAVAIITKG